jgi:hypothetical protein
MWLLRGVRKNRWEDRRADNPSHVAEAARDLSLRPGEDGLSLYQVDDEEDGKRVATLFGVYKRRTRGASDHVDYILISEDAFARFGLGVLPAPNPELGPELSKRHREVRGISDSISQELAAFILEEKRFKLARIKRQDIDKAALLELLPPKE